MKRLPCRLIRHLGVDLHRHRELRMTENPHGHPRMDVQIRQNRRASTPGIPRSNPRHTRQLTTPIPLSIELTRLLRSAVLRCCQQSRTLPRIARLSHPLCPLSQLTTNRSEPFSSWGGCVGVQGMWMGGWRGLMWWHGEAPGRTKVSNHRLPGASCAFLSGCPAGVVGDLAFRGRCDTGASPGGGDEVTGVGSG